MHMKSNAQKAEKYLYRCSMDPVLKSSTLLRDFFSPQREGDSKSIISKQQLQQLSSHVYPSQSSSYDQLVPTPPTNDDDISSSAINNEVDSRIDVGKVWVPSTHPSIRSLPLSRHSSKRSSQHSITSSISKISRHGNSIHSYNNTQHNCHIDDIEDDEDDDLIHIMAKNDNGVLQQQQSEYDFPLDHLEMVKVLGKGCMGKVCSFFSLFYIPLM